jgi:hypothetical protein
MGRFASIGLAVMALVLTAPAVASADPSLRATPDTGEPGDDVILHGRDWVIGSGCESTVTLSFRQSGNRLRLGTANAGAGRFDFATHYQRADPGPARFVARQECVDRVYRRSAYVTIGGSESVRYRGQTEHGGRVSFVVIDGSEVDRFRFMNRCSTDRQRGSLVPGTMAIGDVTFTRRGGRFQIFGRFRASGVVKGTAREQVMGCDSEPMTWRAEQVH